MTVTRTRRRRALGFAALLGGAVWLIASQLTPRGTEAAVVAMPPALGLALWIGWPRVRRVPWRSWAVYLLVMAGVLTAAQAFVARLVGGRVLPAEVFWALYFLVAWRLAWAVWSRTVGRWREATRRAVRRRAARGAAETCDRLVLRAWPVFRASLTALVFAPLFFGALLNRIKIGNPRDLGPYARQGIEDVSFRTADGLTLSGWFWPDRDSDATVIICHGLGANKGNFIDFLSLFHGSGYNGLIFDFRGHGDSAGHAVTFGLYESADVRAAVDWLRRERPAQSRRIFGLGSSMGAMALVRAAADDPRIEAIVLDSCFVSAAAFARDHLGRVPLAGGAMVDVALAALSLHAGRSLRELDARPALARFAPRPVLLIHGDADVMIAPHHLDLLYAAAREPKERWLGPGPHSNIMTIDFVAYQRRAIEFLNRARATSPRSAQQKEQPTTVRMSWAALYLHPGGRDCWISGGGAARPSRRAPAASATPARG